MNKLPIVKIKIKYSNNTQMGQSYVYFIYDGIVGSTKKISKVYGIEDESNKQRISNNNKKKIKKKCNQISNETI